ncbi:MAG TPA: hypothetical protein VK449_06180, partial [Anaerolineales bacterium]|nr:hypothetical protein [Anaerolineales bacterium]
MTFEIWGLTDTFGFGLPQRWSGFLLLAVFLTLFIAVLLEHRRHRETPILLGWPLPGALALAGPVSQAILVVFLAAPSGIAAGRPLPAIVVAAPLLGMVPAVLAAGWLSAASAATVGLAAGIVYAGWYTHGLLTPLALALSAASTAWLLQVPYRDALGSAARRPIVAALAGGLLFALLRCVELYVYNGGTPIESLESVVPQVGAVVRASLLEALCAGLVAEAALFAAPARWRRPQRLSSAPYLRSLGARMVAFFLLVGVAAAVVLLVGDWVLARTSARELVETQLEQTAVQAGAGVPYFGQSGRSYLQQAAAQLKPAGGPIAVKPEGLHSILTAIPFFQSAAVYDSSGAVSAAASLTGAEPPAADIEMEAALAAAMAGVPQEVTQAEN